jgi:1,4-alpha-glucan branching enzyme
MTRPAPNVPDQKRPTEHREPPPLVEPPAHRERMQPDGTPLVSPLGDLDLHLIGEGKHHRLWEALGAQLHGDGARFSVWAPNAREVRLIGDFNGWDRSTMPMSRRPES